MKKILLIEDDPFLVDIYSTKLKEVGYSVIAIKEGKEIMKILREEKPDLILLDIVLPYIDGWQILKEIKRKEDFRDIKVIILSNLSQKEDIEKGLKMGADRFLVKAHYTPSEIVEEIKKILK